MKTIKNKILVSLISALFLCLSLALAFSINTAKVSATVDNDVFVMSNGASIALNKDGLRFRVQMGQNVYDKIFTNDTDDKVELSVLIAPKSYFDELDETENAGKYQLLEKKIQVNIDDVNKVYEEGGYYFANAVISKLAMANNPSISKDQFDLEFLAVGCIATTDGAETSYEYASFYEGDKANNARSQYQVAHAVVLHESDADGSVASAILDKENSPYKTWFGDDKHPIVIDTLEKFDIMTSKIAMGVDFDVNVKLYHKFDIPETEVNLPENITNYYYVNFYNGTTKLQTVEVEEGGDAEITVDYPKYTDLEAMNGGYVRGYKFGGWVTKNDGDTEAVLTNVSSNIDAYIAWVWGDHTAQLLAEAKEEESNGVLFYDRKVGVSQVGCDNGVDFERSYVTDVKWGNEEGSTRLYYENTIYEKGGSVSNPWISVSEYTKSANVGDWILFHVYVDFGDEVTYVDIKHSNTPGVRIFNKNWGSVIFPADGFGSSALRLEIAGKNADGSSSGSFYLSKGIFISAEEAIDLTVVSAETTYMVGNTELVGPVTNYSYDGISTKGTHSKTPNDDVFTQAFNYSPYLINGEIFYYHQSRVDGGIFFTFKNGVNGKVYITARGLGANPGMYAWNTSGDLVHGSKVVAIEVVEGANGYKTYCFDLGNKDVGTVRFHTGYGEEAVGFRQVAISNITVGA